MDTEITALNVSLFDTLGDASRTPKRGNWALVGDGSPDDKWYYRANLVKCGIHPKNIREIRS